jgi:hypothetical protein
VSSARAAPRYYPLDARAMERTCRKLAAALREEYAAGWPPVPLTRTLDEPPVMLSRLEAAERLEEQGDRWAEEARTGVPNTTDRVKLGW